MKAGDIILNRYELVSKLGSGGFGVVWKAIDRIAGNIEVAIKIYAQETGLDDTALNQFKKEYMVVMDLHHPHLLTAKHFDIWDNRPFLIFPLMTGGSLYQKILNADGLSEEEIAKVLLQVADGLAYIHDNDVIHQDVKPDNVLIDSKGRYVLTDFGISSRMRSTLRRATGVQNSKTISFAPPERFGSNQQILPSGDVFSLGVMVYEMATTTLPWMGLGGMHLMPQSELPSLPESFSVGLNSLMQSMLNYYPAKRPTAHQIKEAAQYYLSHGVWKLENAATLEQSSHLGRITSVFDPSDQKKSERTYERSNPRETVISNPDVAHPKNPTTETIISDQKDFNSTTHHSRSKSRTSMVVGILAVSVLLIGVAGWYIYHKNKQEKDLFALKSKIEKYLSEANFKEAYLTCDSLLALPGYYELDDFKNLRQQALDSMNTHFSKSYTLYRLSALLNNKEDMQRHLSDLIRLSIHKDTLSKYEKLLSELHANIPDSKSPVTLISPDQLFADGKQNSELPSTSKPAPASTSGAQASTQTRQPNTPAPTRTSQTSEQSSVSFTSDIQTFFEADAAITARRIGRLYWMLSNSNPTMLRNNTPMRKITDPEEWSNTLAPAYNLYNGTYLYNGIATREGRICPEGWRIPTLKDWEELINSFASSPKDILDHKKFGMKTTGYRSSSGNILDLGYAFYWVAGSASPKASGEFGISILIEGNKLTYDVEKMTSDIGHTGYQCRCVKDI
ncbi:MAG: protein kinase domain-containing protein [Thermaurantimonas sp.]